MALVAGLLFASRSTCSAQDKYLQVTSDSVLAFKLAMSDFPVTALPVDSAYIPSALPVILGTVACGVGVGLFLVGFVNTMIILSNEHLSKTLMQVGGGFIIFGTVALLSGLNGYLIRKHYHGTNRVLRSN